MQCHCYVCDSLAPCLKWGTGILSSDHCHANDKTELWKIQRKNFKLGQTSPLPASTNSGASFRAVIRAVHSQQSNAIHELRNQASRSTAIHTRPSRASRPTKMHALSPSLNSGVQNQVSRPINIPICHTATNKTIPNGANHGRCLESGSALARNRYRPHSAPRQLLGVRSHAIQRERGSGASSLGPQFLRPHTISKGVVSSVGDTLTANHSSRGLSGFNNHVNAVVQKSDRFHTTTGFSNYRNCNGPDDVCRPINSPSFSHSSSGLASLSRVNQHTVTSETQALPQSNDGRDFHQTCIQGNGAPYVACLNSNQHGNELQISSQNENANNGNGNITQCGITSQDTCEPKPHEESPNVTAWGFPAFDSNWTENNTSQSIEAVIECSPLQSPGSTNQPLNIEESGTQFTGSIGPLNEGSHSPGSLVDIENWLLDQDSAPMVTDGHLPFELNIPSPDLAPVDAGTLLSHWW